MVTEKEALAALNFLDYYNEDDYDYQSCINTLYAFILEDIELREKLNKFITERLENI